MLFCRHELRVKGSERLKLKRIFFLILLIGCFGSSGVAFGATQTLALKKINDLYPPLKTTLPSVSQVQSSSNQPQQVDFGACNKRFRLDGQKLFYLTLAGISANHFEIQEIQSKSGYVLFCANQKQFLASVIPIDSKTSLLKITPCSNIYNFSIGIVQNMFRYIELNAGTPIDVLSVM